MNILKAKELVISYGILFPLTMEDFIKQRASIIKEHHTDKGAETDADEFTTILTALNTVKDNFDAVNGFVNSGATTTSITKTGESLASLGKGLGNLVNGKKCDHCLGKGYTIEKTPIFGNKKDFCDCDNGYIYSDKCKYCKGTGKYHTKSGFDVTCKACNGSGMHVYENPRPCPKCSNTRFTIFNLLFGFETIVGYKNEYHKCYHCGGTGEIKIFNPVFQKGSLNIGNAGSGKVTTEHYTTKLKRFNKIMNRR